jgi:hypothetical protein
MGVCVPAVCLMSHRISVDMTDITTLFQPLVKAGNPILSFSVDAMDTYTDAV